MIRPKFSGRLPARLTGDDQREHNRATGLGRCWGAPPLAAAEGEVAGGAGVVADGVVAEEERAGGAEAVADRGILKPKGQIFRSFRF